MIIGYNSIVTPSAWSDFPQNANVLLTVRFMVNLGGSTDGSTDTINFWLSGNVGTVLAKGVVLVFNPVTGNLDRLGETSSISCAFNASSVLQSIVLPAMNFSDNSVVHLGMYADGVYNMKFFNPSIANDNEETQSQETGLTYPTVPANVLNTNLTKYAVSSAIYMTYSPTIGGKRIIGLSATTGLSTITF